MLYSGNIFATNLSGDLLNIDEGLNQFDANLKISGSGFNIEQLEMDVNGSVSNINYNEYSYQNMDISGKFTNQSFNGFFEIGLAISYNESFVVFPYQLAPNLLTTLSLNGSISLNSFNIDLFMCIFNTSHKTRLPEPPSVPKSIILFTLHSKFIGDSFILDGFIRSDFNSVNPAFSNSLISAS